MYVGQIDVSLYESQAPSITGGGALWGASGWVRGVWSAARELDKLEQRGARVLGRGERALSRQRRSLERDGAVADNSPMGPRTRHSPARGQTPV